VAVLAWSLYNTASRKVIEARNDIPISHRRLVWGHIDVSTYTAIPYIVSTCVTVAHIMASYISISYVSRTSITVTYTTVGIHNIRNVLFVRAKVFLALDLKHLKYSIGTMTF
jgi:hypothetical protein